MDNKQMAETILREVGGEENIKNLVHCATRLRFSLYDDSVAEVDSVNKIPGVIGTAKTKEQFQIILGGGKVNNVYDEINKNLTGKVDNNTQLKGEKFSISGLVLKGLNVISEVLTPMVPALAAAGMLKVILLMLTQFDIVADTSTTYQILNVLSDTVFYFLPIITAYLAAEYFKTDKVLSVVVAGVLIHPTFIELFSTFDIVTFFNLPITTGSYSGAIIPSLLMVWFMAKIEPIVDRFSPSMIKIFFKPLVIILIVAPITLLVFGPVGTWVGAAFGGAVNWLYDEIGWLAVGITGALLPFSVLTGLNRALTPMSIQIFTELGHDPLFRTAYIPGNMTQGAAALAVAFKTKNKQFKQIAFSASATTLLSGITEPSLFGVLVKVKKPLIATTIAGFLGGSYAGLMGVSGYALAVPGFLSIPMFMSEDPNNLIHAMIAYAISIIGSFVLTLIIGFDDIPEEEYEEASA